jgi:hypothetical protein
MGFNPHEKFKARTTDYVLMIMAAMITFGLVVWAFVA